jgi:hypothetical protein
MLPATRTRLTQNTTKGSNERIQALTECAVMKYAASPAGEIEARLAKLDREWDIKRVRETNAAAFSLAGLLLGIAVRWKWLALPVSVAGFLLWHALQGRCPPVPVLRALGIRTARKRSVEILRRSRRPAKQGNPHDPGSPGRRSVIVDQGIRTQVSGTGLSGLRSRSNPLTS